MTTQRNREPRGTTTGGQFATESRSEAGVSLGGSGAPAPLVTVIERNGLPYAEYDGFDPLNPEVQAAFVSREVKYSTAPYYSLVASAHTTEEAIARLDELAQERTPGDVPADYFKASLIALGDFPAEYDTFAIEGMVRRAYERGVPYNMIHVSCASGLTRGTFNTLQILSENGFGVVEMLNGLHAAGVPSNRMRQWFGVNAEDAKKCMEAEREDDQFAQWTQEITNRKSGTHPLSNLLVGYGRFTVDHALTMSRHGMINDQIPRHGINSAGHVMATGPRKGKTVYSVIGSEALAEAIAYSDATGCSEEMTERAMAAGISVETMKALAPLEHRLDNVDLQSLGDIKHLDRVPRRVLDRTGLNARALREVAERWA